MPRSFFIESGRVETFDSNILFLLVYFRCIRVEKMNKWFPLLLLSYSLGPINFIVVINSKQIFILT